MKVVLYHLQSGRNLWQSFEGGTTLILPYYLHFALLRNIVDTFPVNIKSCGLALRIKIIKANI